MIDALHCEGRMRGDQNAVIPMEKVNALEQVINLKREMIEVREVELCVAAK